ncbi:hypothetical protein IMSAGC008_02157 [Muribaculaceae bacterium]|nr:hypothetical protein IMSAGC008_02157 [Muribaculaceae bacterium]
MNSHTKERNRDFIEVCLSIIRREQRSGKSPSLAAVVAEALSRSPRCHYVAYDRASEILHMLERSGSAGIATSNLQRVRWLELYSQVREAIDGPRKLSFDKALSFVLAFRRPSRFYIHPARAIRLLRPYIEYRIAIPT